MGSKKISITKLEPDYISEIKKAQEQIINLKHQIQILKTKRKLMILEKGGELCSTCNGVLIFSYGNTFSPYFSAQCEDCKQQNEKYPPGCSGKPVEEWPPID
jgi:hypothetical protein